MTIYPDDADGAVLAELAAQGVDMSQPLVIEFAVAVPDEASAEGSCRAMTNAGYEAHIEHDEGEPVFDLEVEDADDLEVEDEDEDEFGPSWTVYANVRMIPEYDKIMQIQAELDRLVEQFGGKSDGWGVMLEGDADSV